MGGGFDHAQNAAKADRERLQSRALDLQRRVAAPGLEKKEINALTEELHGVIERLALTQHSLDTWTVVQQALVEEEEGEEGGPSEGAAPPVRQTPMLQAVVAREEALPERKASKPLGQQLLADFRRLVRPTLVEQLEGLDSPFQPPSVISVALERALRQHLNKVRQEYDPAHQSDEERPSMSLELGRALVELLRAIAHEQRLTAPRSGIDAVRERVSKFSIPQTLPLALLPPMHACEGGNALTCRAPAPPALRSACTLQWERARPSRLLCGAQ